MYSQKPFAEKLGLPFPILSDANRDLGRALGFLLPEVAGIREVYTRAVLVLDPQATVRWLWAAPDPKTQPDVAAVLAAVAQVVQA